MAAKEHIRWLKANGHNVAALTGTDHRALEAIAACWELYSVERQDNALSAVRCLLGSMQRKCWPLAKALIPRSLDWSDEEPVWARIRLYMPEAEGRHEPGEVEAMSVLKQYVDHWNKTGERFQVECIPGERGASSWWYVRDTQTNETVWPATAETPTTRLGALIAAGARNKRGVRA